MSLIRVDLVDADVDEGDVERAENIQLVVAVAIISAYVSVHDFSLPDSLPPHEIAFLLSAVVSVIFSIGKAVTVTVKPFFSNDYIDLLNDKILPFGYAIFLSSFILSPFLYVLVIFSSERASLLIAVLPVLVFIYAAYVYSTEYSRTMSSVGGTTADNQVIIGSGDSTAKTRLRISNDSDREIDPKDISIAVDSPDGVDVEIRHSRKENGTWTPIYGTPIPPNGGRDFTVCIDIDDPSQIDQGEIELLIMYEGEEHRSEILFDAGV